MRSPFAGFILLLSLGAACDSHRDSPSRDAATPDGGSLVLSDASATLDPTWADDRVRTLVGQMTFAEKIAQLQNSAPAIERLNVPAYQYWNEGLHGVLTNGATSFPQAIALASTWDPDLVHEVASAIADEARGFNATRGKGLTYWSPVINMLRDPRWGRYDESYSEDPWLMSRMGVAFVRGLQGDDPKYLKAVATPKHYAGNNSEYNRHTGSSEIDEQQLHEYYLPAFEATVREGGAFSVMSAYNRVNGVPASANPLLLQSILRDGWGFPGYVVSDCDAVADIVNGHHWVSTLAEASAKALLAGTDLNCGTTYPEQLKAALDQGLIVEADVDRALIRVLRARFLLGEFDDASSVPYQSIGKDAIESAAHTALARKAADEAIVLLKNDGLLPLDRVSLHSVAIIGPHGNDVTLGNYSGSPDHTVNVLDAMRTAMGAGVTVSFSPGCTVTGSKVQADIDAAAALAATSDVAVVVVGTSQDVLNEERDRPDWNLPGAQSELIAAVFAANPRTVVVLVTAGPVAVDWAKAHVPAMLTAFYDGQEQGTAIVAALLGDITPGGKLTTTWYTGDATLPLIGDYDLRKGRTYLYYDQAPLFPFGHGLSYTSFTYANLSVSPDSIDSAGVATIRVDVTNTGSRAGDEVVQLYIHDRASDAPRPIKQLRGFRRIHLEAGETKTVSLTVAGRDLAFWDVRVHGWRVAPGSFDILVGSSSLDIRQQSNLTVRATANGAP